MSLLRILLFFVREAYVNLRRSWKVSLLAVFTITTSLFVGGLFLLLSENLARLLDDWRRQAKVIVYLRAPLPAADRADLVANSTEPSGSKRCVKSPPSERDNDLRRSSPAFRISRSSGPRNPCRHHSR